MKNLFCALLVFTGFAQADDALIQAARKGDLEAISEFSDDQAALNEKNEIGLTPWQVAMISRRVEAADLLAKLGADTSLAFPPPEKSLDELLTSLVGADGPGTAVRVSQNGKVLFEKGYGLAVLDPKTPITPKTKFRIGSVTKQMTAAAILKFVEAGKLTLETKLAKFYPDFPRAEEVTIHHLLTHSSGIKSYTSKVEFFEKVQKPTTAEEVIGSVRDDPYDFDPGVKFQYNNTGYYFLGEIAARLHGKPYPEMMQEVIFKPCGMVDSGVHRQNFKLENESHGYSYFDGKTDAAHNWDMTWADGAGAVYSTVEDLDRWNEAIFAKDFLKPATLEKAFTIWPTQEDPKPKSGYGYGWFIFELNGLKKIGHGGGLHGWSSLLVRFPDEKLTLSVLSNSARSVVPGTSPELIEHAISHFFLWRKMAANNQPKVDEKADQSQFVSYAGRYDYGGAIMVVSERDDRLFAKLTGQPEFEIFPKKGSTFFWKVVEAEITFKGDYFGKITHAMHTQGGRTIKVPKLKGLGLVKLADEQLQAVVGKYLFSPGVFLTVMKEKGQLFAQLTGQIKLPIHPSAPLVFHFRDVDATLKFTLGEGKVTGGLLLQNGAEQKMEKVE